MDPSSDTTRRLRRCIALRMEPHDHAVLDFAAMLSERNPLSTRPRLQALAAHVAQPLDIGEQEAVALARIGATVWSGYADLVALYGKDCVDSLLGKRLLLVEGDTSPAALCDLALRDSHWHPGAAIHHRFSRWSHADSVAERRESRARSTRDMVEVLGPPPPHFYRREDAIARVSLAEPVHTGIDALLARRATCRNFDVSQSLPLLRLSTLLKRVFGAQGLEELAPGAVALKKNHPSGGALHPIEAYVIAQRVTGLVPGLYHYNVEAHALDLLHELSAKAVREFSMVAVAGQGYFADAPVMIVMAARFARSMWKYRNHPKVYRVVLLEAGHISQNLYLTATEMGLGAFITAAINEVEIEQAFGLEPMTEGPLAVCGFGVRAATKTTVEFDPAHKVWDAA